MKYVPALFLFALLAFLLVSCDDPKITEKVVGDRHVKLIAGGKLSAGDGDSRMYYIIRDTDTGATYLAVLDAGIIKLDPKPPAEQRSGTVEHLVEQLHKSE